MKKSIQATIVIHLILILTGIPVKACTTFCISDSNNLVFGRNLDFEIGYAHIVVNKRNLKKIALIEPPEKLMEWTSKYGSVTFNMIGWILPFGGINEKGLVIEQMSLKSSEYPEPDDRYCLDLLQWIQYQLDNSATVNDVIKSDSIIRVSKNTPKKLHFLVADKYGNTATIEFLGGKMVYHMGKNLPYKVLTNSTYENSINYIKQFYDFGGKDTIPNSRSSLDRFAIVASKLKNFNNQDVIDYSFDILQSVSIDYENSKTQWSIVYDIKNLTIYFKTLNNKSLRILSLSEFDFDCQKPNMYTDIDSDMKNNRLLFDDCSYWANRKLIEKVFNGISFMRSVSEKEKDELAKYSETVYCDK